MTPEPAAPRQPTLPQLMLPTSRRLRNAVGSLALASMLALTGCSLLPTGGAVEQTVTHPAQIGNHNGTGNSTRQATKAEELAARVRESLTALGSASKAPSRAQMVAAMLEAGAAQDAVEVSIDRTPTGLAVDAIEAAALLGGDCVIGQVRTGKAVVVILPVLASGRCFVGDQH